MLVSEICPSENLPAFDFMSFSSPASCGRPYQDLQQSGGGIDEYLKFGNSKGNSSWEFEAHPPMPRKYATPLEISLPNKAHLKDTGG